jgi:hypothetical protein
MSEIVEAEATTLARALSDLEQQRKQALNLNVRGRLPDAELDEILDRIETDRTGLQARAAALEPSQVEIVPQEPVTSLPRSERASTRG